MSGGRLAAAASIPTPTTAAAAEALAMVRMLGQLQYKPGGHTMDSGTGVGWVL